MNALQSEIKAAVREATQSMERRMVEMQRLLEKNMKSTQKPFVTVDEATKPHALPLPGDYKHTSN